MFPKMFAIFVLSSLVLAACGASGSSQSVSDPLAQGKTKFDALCASCHGEDGTGRGSAPSIFGHDAEEIRLQVRNPAGKMPAFASTLLADDDLERLVQYAMNLSPEREEAHTGIVPGEEEKAHLMAAYESINDSPEPDSEAAINHLQQAIALATDEAASVYAEIVNYIEFGNAHDANHELAELLGMTED